MFNIQIILQQHETLQQRLNSGDLTSERFARIFNTCLLWELQNE